MAAFTASQFTPTQYDTAEQKARAANAFVRFLERGCPTTGFTRAVYRLLYLHTFGHIAHYNANGFYHTWFSTPEQRADWVQYARRGGAFGFHAESDFSWGDVERAIVRWLDTSGVGDRLILASFHDTEAKERALLAKLQAKYGA